MAGGPIQTTGCGTRHGSSATKTTITLWLVAGSDCTADEFVGAYETCLEIAIRARFDPAMNEITKRFRNLEGY